MTQLIIFSLVSIEHPPSSWWSFQDSCQCIWHPEWSSKSKQWKFCVNIFPFSPHGYWGHQSISSSKSVLAVTSVSPYVLNTAPSSSFFVASLLAILFFVCLWVSMLALSWDFGRKNAISFTCLFHLSLSLIFFSELWINISCWGNKNKSWHPSVVMTFFRLYDHATFELNYLGLFINRRSVLILMLKKLGKEEQRKG